MSRDHTGARETLAILRAKRAKLCPLCTDDADLDVDSIGRSMPRWRLSGRRWRSGEASSMSA